MENKIIKVENLKFKYRNTYVLKDVSFSINQGDYLGIIGPNGSGKTTLIKLLLKILDTEEGEIHYFNDIDKKNLIGYVPQKTFENRSSFPASVKEVVKTGLLANKSGLRFYNKDDNKKVIDVLHKLKICKFKNKRINELSGGQQQRVLLARSLVANPKVIILDEPTSALDPDIREEFYQVLKEINDLNVTVILISHDLLAVENYVNKVLYLDTALKYFGSIKQFKMSETFKSYHGQVGV